MDKQANILDRIQEILDPTVWDAFNQDNPRLKPVHRKWIQGTIYRVLEDNGVQNPASVVELVLTGSLTTYQYSTDSDVDISLFVDWDEITVPRGVVIGWMVGSVDGTFLPGTTHPMQAYVVPKGIEKQDLYQPGLRSGYDLDTNSWIVPPERDRVHDVEKEEHSAYMSALEVADKMDRLLRDDTKAATRYWHRVHKDRQQAMVAGRGDFAPENIKYKMLANRGFFPRLEKATGEHIAARMDKSVRKFVYDADSNKLIVGNLAPEEGVTWNHAQLAKHIGADLDQGNTLTGTIGGKAGNYAMYEAGGRGVQPDTYEMSNAALHQAVPDLDGILGHSLLPHSPWPQAQVVEPLPVNMNVDWSTLSHSANQDGRVASNPHPDDPEGSWEDDGGATTYSKVSTGEWQLPVTIAVKKSGPPKDPPNYREGTKEEHCGNCLMFWKGECWGYDNKKVEKDKVCDSWAPDAKNASVLNLDDVLAPPEPTPEPKIPEPESQKEIEHLKEEISSLRQMVASQPSPEKKPRRLIITRDQSGKMVSIDPVFEEE